MSFFKDIEGDGAVIVVAGVFKQVPLATRDGHLFAKVGGGYVRLMADGSTSKAGMRLDFISMDGVMRDPLGRLCTMERAGAKALDGPALQKLLGVG